MRREFYVQGKIRTAAHQIKTFAGESALNICAHPFKKLAQITTPPNLQKFRFLQYSDCSSSNQKLYGNQYTMDITADPFKNLAKICGGREIFANIGIFAKVDG